MVYGQKINLKFTDTIRGLLASSGGTEIQLDKFHPNTKSVIPNEEWVCEIHKQFKSFFVVKPLYKVGDEPVVVQLVTDKPKYKPSKYQQAVIDFVKNGKGNAVINAVAGSGKSTTLNMILESINPSKSVLMVAFNKDIVAELKEKNSHITNAEITTWHSFGYQALRYGFQSKIEKNKYVDIAKTIIESHDFENENIDRYEYMKRCVKLCELARLNLAKSSKEIEKLAEINLIDITETEHQQAFQMIEIGKKNLKIIDFTDMIYLPVIHNVKLKHADFVLSDESQDQNACQYELLKRTVRPYGGRFIAVGDPKQAIYLFAGSSTDSFHRLLDIPNTVELPLSVCYRCDKTIVNYAKSLVPNIEYRENAEDGILEMEAKLEDIMESDMILCRNTLPLVKLCYQFLKKGIKAFVQGSDMIEGLVALIEKQKEHNILDVIAKLEKELENIIKTLTRKKGYTREEAIEQPLYENLLEKIEIIRVLSDGCGNDTNCVIENMRKIFDENSIGIKLSTIHRSKGLENDRVFLIQPRMLPSPRSKRSAELLRQEYNLKYVAITRAKHYFGIINEDQFDAYKKEK